ncbi:hypothetical protein SARC_14334, partial [Sphaeroforma arctica JP610]
MALLFFLIRRLVGHVGSGTGGSGTGSESGTGDSITSVPDWGSVTKVPLKERRSSVTAYDAKSLSGTQINTEEIVSPKEPKKRRYSLGAFSLTATRTPSTVGTPVTQVNTFEITERVVGTPDYLSPELLMGTGH